MNNVSFGKLHIAASYSERAEKSAKKALASFCNQDKKVTKKLSQALEIIDKETGNDDFRLCCNGGINFRLALQENFKRDDGNQAQEGNEVVSRLFDQSIKSFATPEEKVEFLDSFIQTFRDDKEVGQYCADRLIRSFNDNSNIHILRSPSSIKNLADFADGQSSVMKGIRDLFDAMANSSKSQNSKNLINIKNNGSTLSLSVKRDESQDEQPATRILKLHKRSEEEKLKELENCRQNILKNGIFSDLNADIYSMLSKYTES
ncbi:hypothetical protein II906_03785 [bacterium]|nr:hypothetical protein [bacterium]